MADDFGVYDITGQVQRTLSSSLPGTQPISLESSIASAHPVGNTIVSPPGSNRAGMFEYTGAGGAVSQLTVPIHPDSDLLMVRPGDVVIFRADDFESTGIAAALPGFISYHNVVDVALSGDGGYIQISPPAPSLLDTDDHFQVVRPVWHEPRVVGFNNRRSRQRDIYNRLITGRAFRWEVGQSALSGALSHSLTAPYGSTLATPPSWTQIRIGKHHEFVIGELSSSRHERDNLNSFLSGTAALETSPVPASASLYYSKQSRFTRLVYKLSASAGMDKGVTNNVGPSQLENKPRNEFTSISGSYVNTSPWKPAVFTIDVPDYGRIRDVRVWLEFIHDHRGGTGTGSADASNVFYGGGSGSNATDATVGLQGVQVALRSPNVSFGYAHPLWNDPTTVGFQTRPDTGVSGMYNNAPELLRNSYLLWDGHAINKGLGVGLGSLTSSLPHNWYFSIPVTGAFTNQVYYASMKYDNQGLLNIAWVQPGEKRVYIRRPYNNLGTISYAVERVASVAGSPTFYGTLMRLGQSGSAHLAFATKVTSLGSLYYATSGSAGWNVRSLPQAIDTSTKFAFAIDSRERPMFLARNQGAAFGLSGKFSLYTSGSGDGWQYTDIGTSRGFNSPSFPSIQCDSNDKYHFCFVDSADDGNYIIYGTSGTAGLSTERAFAITGSINSPTISLALAPGNIPTILYCDLAFPGLRILKSGSTGWSVTTAMDTTPGSILQLPSGDAALYSSGTLYAMVQTMSYRGTPTVDNFFLFTSGSQGYNFELAQDNKNITVDVTNANGPGASITASPGNLIALIYDDESSLVSNFGDLHLSVMSGNLDSRDAAYYEYDTDIDMRTIFTDSSRVENPRRIQSLYTNGQTSALQINRARIANSYPSPLSASVNTFNYNFLDPAFYMSSWLTGANFPWMLDARIPPGNFQGRNFSATASLPQGSSPPSGWLTGPGGSNAVNEWPTTGSQIGPTDIRPVYPIMDDVYVEHAFTQPTSSLGSVKKVIGFRPGLRGTEVHGKWKILIGTNTNVSGTTETGTTRGGIWFRQCRLEFLVDTGRGLRWTYAGHTKAYDKPSYVPQAPGKRVVGIISGSAAWDIGTGIISTVVRDEFGRSVGITNTENVSGFAVFSQLTGSLVTALSASGQLAGVQASFLSNEFGTPYIPISSGSGEVPTFKAFTAADAQATREVVDAVLNPTTIVPRDNTLRAFLARSKVAVSTRDAILKKTQS